MYIPSLDAVYRYDSHYETWYGLRDAFVCHVILRHLSVRHFPGIANRTYLVLADYLEIMVKLQYDVLHRIGSDSITSAGHVTVWTCKYVGKSS